MSEPYNPLIANAFFRTGDIEAWGRGIAMIRDACRKNGTDFPTFEFGPTSIMVEFKGTVPCTEDSPGKPLVETPEKTPEKILKALQEDPQRSLAEVATMIGKSASAVERASRRLQEAGKLRRVGPDKGGHWEVLE